VAVTLDGTAVHFYINGAEVSPSNAGFSGNINDVGGPILIGRMPSCGSNDYCDFFDGAMRDLTVFTRAIGAAEVAGLKGGASGDTAGNPEASAADPLGRVFFLPFDAGSGRTFQSLTVDPIGTNSGPLTIGRAAWGDVFFTGGMIDEVTVLEQAASPDDVAAMVAGAPILRMALDETQGATSFSDIASASPATCSGSGCPQAGARARPTRSLWRRAASTA
jgi:hypothetical protein